MIDAALHLHSKFIVDRVDKRLFGGFVEHLGQCVYQGIFEPNNPLSDADGFRIDVRDALRELAISVIRYPGGNFASGYHWMNGIGPKDMRPVVRDLAWQSTEINQFGTDEFIDYCRLLGCQPMLCVNLGTGTPEEAMNWVEYCNSETGTYYSDLRFKNGREAPYNVPLWCLGNEMDGPWQLGHAPVREYIVRARQAAKMMKDCDRRIETIACGSSGSEMTTFPEWDRTVMEELGGLANYISLHRYVGNSGSSSDYLATSLAIDSQIETVDATARYAQAKRRSARRTYLCFDEWNVWYRERIGTAIDGGGEIAPPLLEERYNLEDALVAAMFLLSFIRHADSVKIANLAQLVNVIAPLVTTRDALLKQSLFFAFAMIASRHTGFSLQQSIACPSYESCYGKTSYLDSAAVLDGDLLKVFAINRSLDDAMKLTIQIQDRPIFEVIDSDILTAGTLDAQNTFEEADQVVSKPNEAWHLNSTATMQLPPHSLVATTFRIGI